MNITMTNTSGRLKTFVLAHESYCTARGHCACAITQDRAARRVPTSLTLAAGAKKSGVDENALAVPEIARAVRSGDLHVEREASASLPTPVANKPIATEAFGRRANKRSRGDA
jgi:hypothetical protein